MGKYEHDVAEFLGLQEDVVYNLEGFESEYKIENNILMVHSESSWKESLLGLNYAAKQKFIKKRRCMKETIEQAKAAKMLGFCAVKREIGRLLLFRAYDQFVQIDTNCFKDLLSNEGKVYLHDIINSAEFENAERS